MLSKKEIDQNLQDVEYAIAQQRLEGLQVTAATVDDMKKYARGEISIADCLDRVKKRHMNGNQVFKP